jgi:phenylalanyl-tRNA synthetase beta chain
MKITLKWLRELVDVTLSTEELCDVLSMAGIEVEGVVERRPVWRTVEVAEIVEVAAHPNADRLRLCTVRTARGTVGVVCGASNMRAGDRVALAPPGTELPGNRRIERVTIRGQASEGMLCAAGELDLPDDGYEGIMILPADAPVGRPLVAYLGAEDTVLDLAVTPNRGDCLSVLGIAREVAALTGARLHPTSPSPGEEGVAARTLIRVDVEAPDLCPRYCARVLRGVRIGPSPPWLRTRLEMVGMRPIVNVVDATNYVMLERGQPLHAFDLARVRDRRVVVRRLGHRQPFVTLDGAVRQLEPDDLVIADAEGPIALAGVVGGVESAVSAETRDVLLESAFFVPQAVRRTARRLGVTTDSSYRFERGVDPSAAAAALERVAALVEAIAGGRAARGIVERRVPRHRPVAIRLRPARVNALLGTALAPDAMARPLRALGATVAGNGRTAFRVVAPAHRFDLQAEIDLVEEIARLTGYEHIAPTVPRVPVGGAGPDPAREAARCLREALRAAGLCEMVTVAMVAPEENRVFPGLPAASGEVVTLANPLSGEGAEMRRSLIPGLLRALDENLRHGESVVAGFSIGRVYTHDGGGYREARRLALLLAGTWPAPQIGEPPRACSFGDLKGAVEGALARLHLEDTRWESPGEGVPALHPGKAARLSLGGNLAGLAGALHPDLIAARGLGVEPWIAELDLEMVVQYCPRRVIFRPLPRFPAVQRDVAVVVDVGFQAQQILDAVREAAQPLVEEVRVFDEYTGAPIPEGKKGLAYAISYRATDRTLTDTEVNALHEQLIEGLLRSLPVEVRR